MGADPSLCRASATAFRIKSPGVKFANFGERSVPGKKSRVVFIGDHGMSGRSGGIAPEAGHGLECLSRWMTG